MSFNRPIKIATQLDDVRRCALWHLGRRDHSEKELRVKLTRKTENQQWIEAVIRECFDNSYLNDQRFTESYIRSAQSRGFGLSRIKNELQRKGITSNQLANFFSTQSYNYIDSAVKLLNRKYQQAINNQHLKQKAMRFLQTKGHSSDDIFAAIEVHNESFTEDELCQLEDASVLLSAKFRTTIDDPKTHNKAVRYLVNRGFQFSEAAEAIKNHNREFDND